MTRSRSAHHVTNAPPSRDRTGVAAAGASAALCLALVWLVPVPVLLPVLAPIVLALAGGLALIAWCAGSRRDTSSVNLWDVAGACALVGFAAGVFSDPEDVLYLFESAPPAH
jgi:hypothetical protein